MNEIAVDPVQWSTKQLIKLGTDVIHELSLRATATSSAYRLVAGRCLVAVEQTRLYEKLGLSGSTHYGIQVMGLSDKEACCLRRVARALEELPRMTEAAEHGQIPWGKLRLICSKATADTEAFWLELAFRKNCRDLEDLVSATEHGKLPWEESEEPFQPKTRFQFTMTEQAGQVFERAVQAMSQEAGKPLTAGQVLEHLSIECLAKRPVSSAVVGAYRTEARRGVAAAKRKHARLVVEAQQLALECGLGEAADDLLRCALGAQPVSLEEGVGECLTWDEPTATTEVHGDARDGMEAPEDRLTWDKPTVAAESQGEASSEGRDAHHATEAPGGRLTWDEPIANPRPEGDDDVSGASVRATISLQEDGSLRPAQPDQRETLPLIEDIDNPLGDQPPTAEAGQSKGAEPREKASDWQAQSADSSATPAADLEREARARISALLQKALAEKKFFVDLEAEDWKNSRLRYNPAARLVTPAQRKEILRRDGYCCSTPGCPNRLWLEIHHAVFFSRHGETIRANLVSLCSRCHRHVHKGFLKIEGDADGRLIFRDASGRDLERVHAMLTADWLNFRVGWSGGEYDRHQPYLVRAA